MPVPAIISGIIARTAAAKIGSKVGGKVVTAMSKKAAKNKIKVAKDIKGEKRFDAKRKTLNRQSKARLAQKGKDGSMQGAKPAPKKSSTRKRPKKK